MSKSDVVPYMRKKKKGKWGEGRAMREAAADQTAHKDAKQGVKGTSPREGKHGPSDLRHRFTTAFGGNFAL